MLEEKDLQAIAGLINQSINQSEGRMKTYIDQSANQSEGRMKTYIESKVEKQVHLLAEGHAQILDRLPDAEEQENIKSRVATLEHVVSKHTEQIHNLQQAQ